LFVEILGFTGEIINSFGDNNIGLKSTYAYEPRDTEGREIKPPAKVIVKV
jgi:hypothetical protein